MKKLVLFFAMAAVITLSACQHKAQQHETAPAEPVQTEEVVEPAPVPAEEAPVEEHTEAPAETPAE